MTRKNFLLTIAAGAILSAASIILLVTRTAPETSGFFIFFVFFTSLFLFLWAVIFLTGDFIKSKVMKNVFIFERINDSVRHAVLLSLLLILWLFLNSRGLLRWWNFILLVIMVTALEFVFMSAKGKKEQSND